VSLSPCSRLADLTPALLGLPPSAMIHCGQPVGLVRCQPNQLPVELPGDLGLQRARERPHRLSHWELVNVALSLLRQPAAARDRHDDTFISRRGTTALQRSHNTQPAVRTPCRRPLLPGGPVSGRNLSTRSAPALFRFFSNQVLRDRGLLQLR